MSSSVALRPISSNIFLNSLRISCSLFLLYLFPHSPTPLRSTPLHTCPTFQSLSLSSLTPLSFMDTVLNQLLITYHYTHRSILSPHWRSFFLNYIVINRDSQSVNVQGVNDCGVLGPKRDIYFAILCCSDTLGCGISP